MMHELRLGDIIDDYCIKCRRLTNHAIVSLMGGEVAKVRCRSCYHDHTYLKEIAPPSKKDLKKAELFNAVLAQVDGSILPAAVEGEDDPVPETADIENVVAESEAPESEAAEPETASEAREPKAAKAAKAVPSKSAAKKTRGRVKKA